MDLCRDNYCVPVNASNAMIIFSFHVDAILVVAVMVS